MNQQKEEWIPAKGETVYVFRHKTRRVRGAIVKSFISTGGGAGAITIVAPFGLRSTFNMICVGRTPEEAIGKVLARAKSELKKQQSLVKFLEKKLSD